MQLLTIGWAYRFFAYANLVAVIVYAFYQYKGSEKGIEYKWIKYSAIFSFSVYVIHFFAVQDLEFIKPMRHILLAVFLVIGTAMLDNKEESYIRKHIFIFSMLIISAYVALQAMFIWLFNAPYGTTTNPHYLALNSSVCLILALYCFFKASPIFKFLLAICIILLGVFLVQSSSRPAWIALILTGCLVTCFFNSKGKIYALLSMTVVLLSLFLTNVGNFTERTKDLIENINTEERVAIWRETWIMQNNSSLQEWVVGHGLDSFAESFKPYSSHHLKGADFNSPHNYLLDLLFTSGILGVLVVLTMFWTIYKRLIYFIKLEDEQKSFYIALIAVLTTSVILGGITLIFFYSYTMNIIALVVGAMFYLNKKPFKQNITNRFVM
jgi:O-antigen ligase